MNSPTDTPSSIETDLATPAPTKPARRRRTTVADGGVAGADAAGAGVAAAQDAPAKTVRKRRVAPSAVDAASAGQSGPAGAEAQGVPAATEAREQRESPNVCAAPAEHAAPVRGPAADPAAIAQADDAPADRGAERQEGDRSDGAAAEPGAPQAGAADVRGERNRRRNRRERQRANRAAEAAAATEAAAQARTVSPQAAQQLGALFAQVVSGQFDDDDGADAGGGASDAALPREVPGGSAAEPMAVAPVNALADSPADGQADAADAQTEDAPDGATAGMDAREGAQAGPAKRVLAPEPDAPKLQKVLGQAGVGSRRDMEELIADGRVTVNGEPAHIGQRISWGDRIEVNGRAIKYRIAPPPARILAYHKPVGEVVTHDDPQQRPTVFRGLPRLQHGKWQSVGRLDINTEGLLLLTTSGELAHQLMHPRFGVEREYAVRVLGALEPQARESLLQGVTIDGQQAGFKSIEEGGGEGANRWYRVVIAEGRNREVRKLFDAVGLTVSRLIRIRYGSVVLPRGLKRGAWVDLGPDDVRLIRQLAGGARTTERPSDATARGNRGAQGGERTARPNDRGGRNDRGARPQPPQGPAPSQRADRGDDEDLDFDPMRIPNPLEQTFDRRFAKNQRSPFSGRTLAHGGGGFGAGGSAPESAPKRGGGPKEPDPLQTSLGFIGGDAFYRKGGRGGGASGSGHRGGQRGGGKGGHRGR